MSQLGQQLLIATGKVWQVWYCQQIDHFVAAPVCDDVSE